MHSHLRDAVEIELVIEGSRKDLYEKITTQPFLKVNHQNKGCKFFVQKIYPSNDDIVFEVTFNNIYYVYYAFKFREFIICPAFLGEFFGLVDYSCLVVTKTFYRYYYIFLDSSYDDYLLIISKYSSNIQQFSYSVIPENQTKILTLNSKNKDVLSLINESSLASFPVRFILEVGGCIWDEESGPVHQTDYFPEYKFISRNYFYKFEKKYGSLFSDFDILGTLIIHTDSAISKKIQEFIKLSEKEKKRPYLFSNYTPEAYKKTPCRRENYIVEKLINHIRGNYEEGRILGLKKYFSCMFHIFQSSGYGKSRLVKKLGKMVPTFYSSAQKGFRSPDVSFLLALLIEKLDYVIGYSRGDCFMNNIATAMYVYIIRIIYIILTNFKKRIKSWINL
jgi:hypothetical protein